MTWRLSRDFKILHSFKHIILYPHFLLHRVGKTTISTSKRVQHFEQCDQLYTALLTMGCIEKQLLEGASCDFGPAVLSLCYSTNSPPKDVSHSSSLFSCLQWSVLCNAWLRPPAPPRAWWCHWFINIYLQLRGYVKKHPRNEVQTESSAKKKNQQLKKLP